MIGVPRATVLRFRFSPCCRATAFDGTIKITRPLGYDIKDRKLIVNETEAAVVRKIFERFSRGDTVTAIVRQLTADKFRNKYGQALDKGRIYKLLKNRVYIGDAVHKGAAYPGEHRPLVSQLIWDRAQAILSEAPRTRAARNRAQSPALLKGLIFDANGRAMSPTHTRRGAKLYRYYVSQSVIKGGADDSSVGRLPAAGIEAAVVDQLRTLLRSPEVIVATWRAVRESIDGFTEADVREALEHLDPLWDELFPAEQARIVRLLVERVDIDVEGIDVRLRVEELTRLIGDLRANADREAP